jgi:hypothetical protein
MDASTITEYAFILHSNTTIEIAFGNYDVSQKLYLPLVQSAP